MHASEEDLAAQMMREFGPTMCGPALYRALGFATYAAFRRSRSRGELGVHVFKIPARKGVCALTTDIAAWLSLAASKPSLTKLEANSTEDS